MPKKKDIGPITIFNTAGKAIGIFKDDKNKYQRSSVYGVFTIALDAQETLDWIKKKRRKATESLR